MAINMFQTNDEKPFYLMPIKTSVAEEPNPSFNRRTKKSCSNCTEQKSFYESTIANLESNLSRRFDDKFAELKRLIQSQSEAILQMIGQKSSTKIDKAETCDLDSSIPSYFPISTEESLHRINNHICQKNKDIYFLTIQKILQDNLNKNLDKVLSMDIMIMYNLDGTQGKKSLKTYDRLLKVLFTVIERISDGDDPDTLLRRAITKLKNRYYKRVSRNALKLKSMNDDSEYNDDEACNASARLKKRKKL